VNPRRLRLAGALAGLALVAACGSSGPVDSPPTAAPGVGGAGSAPDIQKFLQLPVATPSVCPSNENGTTIGRASPWVGHVDLSIFLSTPVSAAQTSRVRQVLAKSMLVHRLYFESQSEAYAEFQRLYTCWASVSRSQTPPSYRVLLLPSITLQQRNGLVQQLVNLAGVDSVSCDPNVPCTQIHRTT